MSSSTALQKENDTYKDFILTKVVPIKELQCVYKEIRHIPTGAEIVHVMNDDTENVFCLAFQTRPYSSNGVAHILEHTVLCGSEKYPVKDPFFSMIRRSLNTYMNALTASDMTLYPAASQVPKDFYNLFEVYLDAVFKPNLKELSFSQEGHRIEFTPLDNAKGPLEYKGIVFNEMKGSLAAPTSRLWENIMEALFPNSTYEYNSGGTPQEIPNLTYQELLDFHRKYYHPSRCLYYFYGNLPIEERLDFLTQHVLHDHEKLEPLKPIPLQKRYTEPQHFSFTYPISPDEDDKEKHFIALSWLTCHLTQQTDLLALNLIEIILMGSDAAPLKHALLKSGLCKNSYGFLDEDICEAPYILILEGCAQDKTNAVIKLVQESLKKLVDEKIPPALIEGALHQLEFHRSEITSDHGPFGLSLFFRLVPTKMHGGDAEKTLMIHSLFKELRQLIADPEYLPSMIERYLLNNPHFISIALTPDKTLSEQEKAEEDAKLVNIKSTLTEDAIQSILKKSRELAQFQQEQDKVDIDILPKVTLEDVSKTARRLPLKEQKIGHIKSSYHDCFTNDIVYSDILFSLPPISMEDLPFLRLFTYLLPQVGAGKRTYMENLDYILEHTGGVHAALDLHPQSGDYNQLKPAFSLQGKALNKKSDKLFPLLKDMLVDSNFQETARLEELLIQHVSDLENDLNSNAMRYATTLAAANLNLVSKILDEWYGLGYLHFMQKLVKDLKKNLPNICDKLEYFRKKLINGPMHIITACQEKDYLDITKNDFFGLNQIAINNNEVFNLDYTAKKIPSQGRTIASPVAFTCMTLPSIPFIHPDAGALTVASRLMDNTSLHTNIREQGGAYGGGSTNKSSSGKFYFYAYRDPNLATTIDYFHQAVEKIITGDFSSRELEEAKLSVIQKIDTPIIPGHRAFTAFAWLWEAKTELVRQNFRTQLITASKDSIVQALSKHIMPNMKDATIVSFASKEFLEAENDKLKKANHTHLEIYRS